MCNYNMQQYGHNNNNQSVTKYKTKSRIFYQPDSNIIFSALWLIRILKALKSSISFKHIKGTLVDNEATLNIAAHNAATASLKLNNKNKLILTEAKVRVKIYNKTVTAHARKI
jgi:hypothetical protein